MQDENSKPAENINFPGGNKKNFPGKAKYVKKCKKQYYYNFSL